MRNLPFPFFAAVPFLMATILLISASGCSHGEITVSTYKIGVAATFVEAPVDGTYELFGGSGERKATYELTKGDNVGFRPGENGKIIAVAGPDEVELSEGVLLLENSYK